MRETQAGNAQCLFVCFLAITTLASQSSVVAFPPRRLGTKHLSQLTWSIDIEQWQRHDFAVKGIFAGFSFLMQINGWWGRGLWMRCINERFYEKRSSFGWPMRLFDELRHWRVNILQFLLWTRSSGFNDKTLAIKVLNNRQICEWSPLPAKVSNDRRLVAMEINETAA